jgi:signal transduction histidine kinase
MIGQPLNQASVLILSDDTEFARTVAARWKAARYVPEITLATSDVWQSASAAGYALVIVGPVHGGKSSEIFSSLGAARGAAIVCATDGAKEISSLRAEHPHVLVVPRHDGWIGTLILLSGEAIRRVEAVNRAQQAERLAIESQGNATLGRYMLDMRPSVNNALTSVLGNADLLLLEPGQVSRGCRDQIQTIHTMALRLNEIMQRFSSLATEMRAGEKDSQAETDTAAADLVTGH